MVAAKLANILSKQLVITMIPEIKLISKPDIDMSQFLHLTATAIGYDPARAIDNTSRLMSDTEKFISALSCFHNEENINRPVGETISDSASICSHLNYSMLFVADRETIFKSMERSGLQHTVADGLTGAQLAFVSGSLQQWKTATLECCNDTASYNLRLLFDKVMLMFESIGLKLVWNNIRKKSMKDKTFILEHK